MSARLARRAGSLLTATASLILGGVFVCIAYDELQRGALLTPAIFSIAAIACVLLALITFRIEL